MYMKDDHGVKILINVYDIAFNSEPVFRIKVYKLSDCIPLICSITNCWSVIERQTIYIALCEPAKTLKSSFANNDSFILSVT